MDKPEKQRILIVDDEERNLKLVAAIFSNYGYNFETARNGIEALEKTKTFNPDIIFLDVMMPGMDGYEVCRRIKGDALLQHIPVVMVTALEQRESKIEGLKAGADDFLTKPIDSTELILRAKNLLRVKEFEDFLSEHNRILAEQVAEKQRNEEAEEERGGRDDPK